MTQIVDLKREVTTRQRAGVVVGATAALVLLIGAFFAGTQWLGSDEAAIPASPPRFDRAQRTAEAFLAAYDAFDADRMLGLMTDDAVTPQWESKAHLRGETAWRKAVGESALRDPCRPSNGGDTVFLRCDFSLHLVGSERLGLGPYGGGYWSLHVRGGKVTYALSDFPYETNGYAAEVWEPFVAFVESTYPDDADRMFLENDTLAKTNAAALPLWKQHVEDFVAAVQAGDAG